MTLYLTSDLLVSMHFTCPKIVFLILLLMMTSTSAFPLECDEVLLYCGGGVSVIGVGNRTWMPDQLFKCLSTSGESKTSPALTQDPSVVPSVPYMSARVFKSPFTYSFPVASGRKFLRLYFYPNSYDGLNATLSLSSGPYTLLRNFSASQTVQEMSLSYIVKEFVVNVEGGTLNLTFTPESTPSNAYAFVNGIEVTSMPDIYPNRVFTIVGSLKPIAIDNNTVLEVVYRVNIGGRDIYPSEDALYRTWYQDLFIYSSTRGNRVSGVVVRESVHSYAPEEVYRTARTMVSSLAEENLKFNLSWSFTVDSRFRYLIRLHFCEVAPGVDKSNQRVFSIFLNSATAEPKADLIEWSGGKGLAMHRDYIVDVASYNRILVDLRPNEDSLYYDAILNGLEIFKLNTSDGNLAGPNPLPSPPVTPQPHKFKRVTHHRLKKALIIAGLVLSAVVVLGVVVAVAVAAKYRHRRTAQPPQPEPATACCRHFSLAEVEAATENFHESRLIGVGGFGKVYRGQLDGGDVAIKRATPKSNHDLHQFQTEIETLSKLRHRHLVSLTGCCEEDGELILIYDFMSEGTLKDHLHGSSSNVPLLPWKRRVEICIGAARGLHYLHTGASHTIRR